MGAIRILVAEDDLNIQRGLIDTLESEGYRATPAADGVEALELLETNEFDLVLLDIMMPGKSGYDVCRAIRSRDEGLPVIMLTCKGEEIDKVVGLQLGADDYVTKPFGVRELLARIEAVLRRSRRQESGRDEALDAPDIFPFGTAQVDAREQRMRVADEVLDISSRELKLLQFFYSHPNQVVSRDELLSSIWGVKYYGTTRTVDQHIAQLRKKIETDPSCPRFITTVHGVGYRYNPRDT